MNTRVSDIVREPPEGTLTAAEYVLGVLDLAAMRAVEARLTREPALALDVAAWQSRLVPLINEIVPVPVPLSLWPRVRAAAGIANDADDARSTTSSDTPSLLQSLPFWRWLTAGGFAAAAASFAALFIALHPQPQPLPPAPVASPELVATMTQDDGKALFVATINKDNGKLVILPLAVSVPTGRVAELWLIPPGGAPHSLGLVDPLHAQPVNVPASLRDALGPKALVAVTIEPPGGAPEGKPTGPIIAKGEIAVM